jgi:hypothetical protein
MKIPYTVALALLLLASCAPSIDQSTSRAEAAAARAERSATIAEQSADQASKASARVSVVADDAEDDSRRANDAASRMEHAQVASGELLVKPTQGSLRRWCLVAPPIVQGSPGGVESVDFYAPRSRFWVATIFDSNSDCHDWLRKIHRQFVHSTSKGTPFRAFCAACANEADDDEH